LQAFAIKLLMCINVRDDSTSLHAVALCTAVRDVACI